jgi:signal transduction histidine kinase
MDPMLDIVASPQVRAHTEHRTILERLLPKRAIAPEALDTFQMLRTMLLLVWGGYVLFACIEMVRRQSAPIVHTAIFGAIACAPLFLALQRGHLCASAMALTALVPSTITIDSVLNRHDPFPIWYLGVLVSPIVSAIGLSKRAHITATIINVIAITGLALSWIVEQRNPADDIMIIARAASVIAYLVPLSIGAWLFLNRMRASEARAQLAQRAAELHVTRLQRLLDIRHELGESENSAAPIARLAQSLSETLGDPRVLVLTTTDSDTVDLRVAINARVKPGTRWRIDKAFDRPLLTQDAQGHRAQSRSFQEGHALARVCQNLFTRNGCAHLFPSTASGIVAPLMRVNEAIGLVLLIWPQGHAPSAADAQIAEVYAAALRHVIVTDDMRQQQVERAAANERRRIAHDLHDSVSQTLYGIALAAHTLSHPNHDAVRDAGRVGNHIRQLSATAMDEMRALLNALQPAELASNGLCNALRKHVEQLRMRGSMCISVSLPEEEPVLETDKREALYRIGVEALNNACKHANATDVHLALTIEHTHARLIVSDNGVGFNPGQDSPGHYGLRNMRTRAELLGGVLTIDSDTGTVVTALLPC